ncbi:hypothetical protein VDG39_12390 [Xanthomonas campestris pv. raphani]|nr:hypothetical protein [Xanthomonas campestris]MEA9913497.1 hypothetical protein [Xanthomonas campestris pv. raphani]
MMAIINLMADSKMADKDYSLQALNEFIDYLANKHLLNKNTAQSRKGAANKILGVLDAQEASDLSKIDLDMVFTRFANKAGKDYKPDSLMVYRSRLSSALTDFFSYVENPAQFRPAGKSNGAGSIKKPAKQVRKAEERPSESKPTMDSQASSQVAQSNSPGSVTVPVPLREGVTVQITGLPADLTEAEASRLAAIIKAYAMT